MATQPASVATNAPSRRGPWPATVVGAATLRARQAHARARQPMGAWRRYPRHRLYRAPAFPGRPCEGAPRVHSAAAAPAAEHSGSTESHRSKAGGCVRPSGDVPHRTKPPAPALRRPKSRNPRRAPRLPPAGRPACPYMPAPSSLFGGRSGSSDKAFALHPARGIDAAPRARGNDCSDLPVGTGAAHSRCARRAASAGGSKVGGLRRGTEGRTASLRSDACSASPVPSPTANWSCSRRNEALSPGSPGAASPLQAGCDTAPTWRPRPPTGLRTGLGPGPLSMLAISARARRSRPTGRSLAPTPPSTAMWKTTRLAGVEHAPARARSKRHLAHTSRGPQPRHGPQQLVGDLLLAARNRLLGALVEQPVSITEVACADGMDGRGDLRR